MFYSKKTHMQLFLNPDCQILWKDILVKILGIQTIFNLFVIFDFIHISGQKLNPPVVWHLL